jgi:hypothetical protein
MPLMTVRTLAEDLRAEVPEAGSVVDDHLATYDELLPHVLFGDVTRFVMDAYEEGRSGVERRCLEFMERALRDGDDDVKNVIQVSFVENVGPWDPAVRDWIATWPLTVRQEAERQSREAGA